MRKIFSQSIALDQDPNAGTNQNLNKLINRSKSTVNESYCYDLDDINKKQQIRIEKMQKAGLIDFSIEPKYCQNLNESLNFKEKGDQSLDLAKKIEIIQKREKLKALADDSRLDDSRKYLINGETPRFEKNEKIEEKKNA